MRVKFSIIVRPTEDPKIFVQKLAEILPEEAEIRKNKVKGFFGEIEYISAEVKGKEAEKVIKKIGELMSESTKRRVREGVERFVDEKGVLHLRFSKDYFVKGVFELSEGGRVVKVEANIDVFPRKRDKIVGEYIRVLGI